LFSFSDNARQTRFAAFAVDLPPDHAFGEAATGVGNCRNKSLMTNSRDHFHFAHSDFADVFDAIMKRHGYPVEDAVELFPGSKVRTADLDVGARIVDAITNECYPGVGTRPFFVVGDAYLKIEWSVFSRLEKKVILTVTTEGSTYTQVESEIGYRGIVRPAFADALERLATDPKYRDVVDPPRR